MLPLVKPATGMSSNGLALVDIGDQCGDRK